MFYFLLPYMEQEAVYELGVSPPPFASSIHQDSLFACESLIPAYLCPSDPSHDSNKQHVGDPAYFGSPPGLVTHTNTGQPCTTGMCYAGNLLAFDPNPLEPCQSTTLPSPSSSCYTGHAKGTLNEAMLDGTSNTIAMAHRYKICTNNGGPHNQWWASQRTGNGSKQMSFFGWGDYWRPQPFPNSPTGERFNAITSGASYTSASQQNNGNAPDGRGIPFQVAPQPNKCTQNVTQSPHPGVTVVTLGDGSTRSVAGGISTPLWYKACHPSDGQAIGNW